MKKTAVFLILTQLFCNPMLMAHQGEPHEQTGVMPSGGSSAQSVIAEAGAVAHVDQKNDTIQLTSTPQHAEHPHPDDPVKDAEHVALLNLVQDANATVIVDADTDWSAIGAQEGDKIVIKEGVTVTVDEESQVKLEWVRVDGSLIFAKDKNTSLKVVTLVVNTMGTLEVGTADNRIQSGVTAQIIIADRGERDEQAQQLDPMDLTGGLISHGKASFYGEEVAASALLSSSPKKGDTQIILSSEAQGWKVGDILVLAGANAAANEDEQVTITAISADGKTISFASALKFNHDSAIPAGNLTRNIAIYSENMEDISRRGHVMFMHSMNVNIDSAGFYGLGRTDARKAVTDPALDGDDHLLPGSDSNTRGRYAVHFHVRSGADFSKIPSTIRNSAVVDSPKFGIVNHGSYVLIENNVTYDIDGSHIFLENGSEIGAVTGNLMIRARGNAFQWKDPNDPNARTITIRDGQESRKDIFDFGFEGHGIWAQGGGVDITDNFASGMAESAYIIFTTTVKEGGENIMFLVKNLKDGAYKDSLLAQNITEIHVGSVPFYFARNRATASSVGFQSKFHLLSVKDENARSVVEDSVFWNNRTGSVNMYTNQLTFRNVRLTGNVSYPRGYAFVRNDVTRSLVYENVIAEGFAMGIMLPVNGINEIRGGYLNNVINIDITTTNMIGRRVSIDTENLVFGTLSAEALLKAGAVQQLDIQLRANFKPKSGDISKNFEADVITATGDDVRINGKQIYYEEQAADFVPFKRVVDASGQVVSDTLTGTELDNLSNQELWDRYRLAIGGVIAPANATTDSRIKGLIGDPATYDPRLTLQTSRFTNSISYTMKVRDSQGSLITKTTTLNENTWNIVSVEADGIVRSVLIYHDGVAPTFIPDAMVMKPENLIINPLDIAYGFKVVGKRWDTIGTLVTSDPVEVVFKLAKDPNNPRYNEFVISADGQYLLINLYLKDNAGNISITPISVRITEDAPIRLGNVGAFGQRSFGKSLPARLVSNIVKFLVGANGLNFIRMAKPL